MVRPDERRIKVEAWKRAASILEDEASEMLEAPQPARERAIYDHILKVIIPNLRRRADIIDR